MSEADKAQTIRLIDVFLLGPFMIWAGQYMPTQVTRYIMIGSGVATILYNGRNFVRNRTRGQVLYLVEK